jgi:fatty-acyl-CoA synthase
MTIEYDQLGKNDANYVPLSPISFLHRTADIYPEHQSLIYHDTSYTWSQTRDRCVRVASSFSIGTQHTRNV